MIINIQIKIKNIIMKIRIQLYNFSKENQIKTVNQNQIEIE